MPAPLRKLMIRTWFGDLPPWFDAYCGHVQRLKQHGWDFWVITDYEFYRDLFLQKTGIEISCPPGSRKAGDYDPANGVVLADYLRGYEFWGHVGLDCVFGRVERFMCDAFLDGIDVYGNDPQAICGPFSIYRNLPKVNELWRGVPGAADILASSKHYGFDEEEFSRWCFKEAGVDRATVRMSSGFLQAHDKQPHHVPRPRIHLSGSGALIDEGLNYPPTFPFGGGDGEEGEVMMFHFNRKDKKHQWPVKLSY